MIIIEECSHFRDIFNVYKHEQLYGFRFTMLAK